jgi:hypothetical protein
VYFRSLGIYASGTPPRIQRVEPSGPCGHFMNNQDAFHSLCGVSCQGMSTKALAAQLDGQGGLHQGPDGSPPYLTVTTGQPTWMPAAVRTLAPMDTTYPLVLAPTKPLTVCQVDPSAAALGFVIGDVILKARFADGTMVDGTTLTGNDFGTLLMQKSGQYTLTVLSQGGIGHSAKCHGPMRRDLPWYPWQEA